MVIERKRDSRGKRKASTDSRPCRCRSSLGLQRPSLPPQNATANHRQIERETTVRRSFLLSSCRRVPPPFPAYTPASMACGSSSAQTAGSSISAYRRSRRCHSGSWRCEGESPPGFRFDFRLFLRYRFLAGEMHRLSPLLVTGDVPSGGARLIRSRPYLRFLAGVIPVLVAGEGEYPPAFRLEFRLFLRLRFYLSHDQAGKTYLHTWALVFLSASHTLILETLKLIYNQEPNTNMNCFGLYWWLHVLHLSSNPYQQT